MLLSSDLHEDFINEESVAIALMLPTQPLRIFRPKLITPEANRFIADRDTPLCEQVLDVAMTQVESMVKPYGVLVDFRWKAVSFVHFWLSHGPNTGRFGANLSVPTGQLRISSLF